MSKNIGGAKEDLVSYDASVLERSGSRRRKKSASKGDRSFLLLLQILHL